LLDYAVLLVADRENVGLKKRSQQSLQKYLKFL
jgi:hypothetical protein